MGLPEEEERVRAVETGDLKKSADPDILQVGEYTVQLSFQEDSEETIEDRLLVFSRRLLQILLEEEIERGW